MSILALWKLCLNHLYYKNIYISECKSVFIYYFMDVFIKKIKLVILLNNVVYLD